MMTHNPCITRECGRESTSQQMVGLWETPWRNQITLVIEPKSQQWANAYREKAHSMSILQCLHLCSKGLLLVCVGRIPSKGVGFTGRNLNKCHQSKRANVPVGLLWSGCGLRAHTSLTYRYCVRTGTGWIFTFAGINRARRCCSHHKTEIAAEEKRTCPWLKLKSEWRQVAQLENLVSRSMVTFLLFLVSCCFCVLKENLFMCPSGVEIRKWHDKRFFFLSKTFHSFVGVLLLPGLYYISSAEQGITDVTISVFSQKAGVFRITRNLTVCHRHHYWIILILP